MGTRTNGAELNIANGIREFAVATPAATAVVDGQRSLTYAGLNERSSRLAQAMLAVGLRTGDRVAIVLGNRLEYCEVACGLAKAGLVSVPINPRLTAPEVAYILEHSGSRAVILDEALRDVTEPGVAHAHVANVVAIGGDYEDALARARPADPEIEVPETEPFTICYTAGTTGKPKGVVISHRSRAITFYLTALEWGLGPGRMTLAVAPMYHGAGFAFAYAACVTGGTVAMMGSFDPELLLAMIEQNRPSSVFLVPAHIQMLRALGEEAVRRADTSSLTTIYVNAAPLPQQAKIWTIENFPSAGLHELYGSTEASIVTNLRPPDQLRKERCVGPPWFMTQVRVLDIDGTPVKPGQPGELWSRSPMVFRGYLDDPEATGRSTSSDGFVSAGDIAVVDDENYVYIVDRLRDMIISGGVNVYPREVEEVLHKHPAVSDVAVVGAPDERWGERVVAIVVAKGPVPPPVEELIQFSRRELAGYKLPKEVRYVAALPRNAAGKVLKRDLRDQLARDPA
jgi:long-chain acyl-CoA synthetase